MLESYVSYLDHPGDAAQPDGIKDSEDDEAEEREPRDAHGVEGGVGVEVEPGGDHGVADGRAKAGDGEKDAATGLGQQKSWVN